MTTITKKIDGWYTGDRGPFRTRQMAREANKQPVVATTTTTETARRAPGTGVVETIRKAFQEGHVTVAEVARYLEHTALNYSLATVRTQVGALRREAGLTTRDFGPVAMIRKAFEQGNVTVADVEGYLASNKIPVSQATVKTQVGKLRRAAGLTRKAA